MNREEAMRLSEQDFRALVQRRLERILKIISSVNGNGRVPSIARVERRKPETTEHTLLK